MNRGKTIAPRRACVLVGLLLASCSPSRVLVVDSDPPGATVRLDDQLLGRTPLEAPFDHYGRRRLTVYLEGYRTHSEVLDLSAPWHARFPIDLVTEVILPLGLEHRVEVAVPLVPDADRAEALNPWRVVERARAVRETVRRPAPLRPPPQLPVEQTGPAVEQTGSETDRR